MKYQVSLNKHNDDDTGTKAFLYCCIYFESYILLKNLFLVGVFLQGKP